MRYAIWALRMWLAERLLDLGCWLQPEYRSRSRETEDGTIAFWREPR